MKNLYKQKNKGFTLVETLMAISIFVFAVLGLSIISAGSVSNINFVRNRLVAQYLAEEGIELTRNIRDTQTITDPSGGWVTFKGILDSGMCTTDDGCNIDPEQAITSASGIVACNQSPTSCVIKMNGSNGYYGANITDTDTIFKRQIIVDTSSFSGEEFSVTSIVTWNDGVNSKSITMVENIYNWK